MGQGLSIGTSAFAMQPMVSSNLAGMGTASMVSSVFGTGTSSGSSGYASANETAEQREKRLEREIQKKENEIARNTRKEQQALIAQMQQNPDVFAELTDEEEKILLEYMTKMDKAENDKGIIQEGMSVGSAAMCYVPLVGMVGTGVSYLGHGAAWCGRKIGLDKVGNSIANSKPGRWVADTASSVKNSGVVRGSRKFLHTVDRAPSNIIHKATKGAQMGAKATKTVNWCKNMTTQVASKGAAAAAITTVIDDFDELGVAYKDGFGSGVKQTAQTAVKAGAAAGGFWVGAKGGAALGASIGSCLGPIGSAVGGLVGGLVGGIFGSWGAKKVAKAVVGQDVGDKIREEQTLQVANAEKGAELSENQLVAVNNVLAYAQQDQEIDEKTMAVLSKLATRSGLA